MQQSPRDPQARLHIATVVHVRVVDEPLPSDGRARLFEIHAHHEEQAIFDGRAQLYEALGVVEGRVRVVDRAGPNQAEQPLIGTAENLADGLARINHRLRDRFVNAQLFLEHARSDELLGGDYV